MSLTEAQRAYWTPRESRVPWRDFLTADEAAEVSAIDAEMVSIKTRMRHLSSRRNPIQNRAINRAKYALQKDASHER